MVTISNEYVSECSVGRMVLALFLSLALVDITRSSGAYHCVNPHLVQG